MTIEAVGLQDACSRAQVVDADEQEERRLRETERRLLPQFLAQSSATMIHQLESRLLVIEPENFLKRRANLTVKCEAKSQARLDSFNADCVPLLRALLLLPACQSTGRATEKGGEGGGEETRCEKTTAHVVEWHPAAPFVALCTDFGVEAWLEGKQGQAALDKIAKTLEDLRCVKGEQQLFCGDAGSSGHLSISAHVYRLVLRLSFSSNLTFVY